MKNNTLETVEKPKGDYTKFILGGIIFLLITGLTFCSHKLLFTDQALERMESDFKSASSSHSKAMDDRVKAQTSVVSTADDVCKKWKAVNSYKNSVGIKLEKPEEDLCAKMETDKLFQ